MEEKYIEQLIETETRSKSNTKRIDKMENDIGEIKELTIAVKELAIEMKQTNENVSDMNDRLKVIEEKPAKNWDNLVKTIITRNSNGYFGLFFGKIRNIKKFKKRCF